MCRQKVWGELQCLTPGWFNVCSLKHSAELCANLSGGFSSLSKREVCNRNVFLNLEREFCFSLPNVQIVGGPAEIWEHLHLCVIRNRFLALSTCSLRPRLRRHSPERHATLLPFFQLLFQLLSFPLELKKMCVLVGPVNLHFLESCSPFPFQPWPQSKNIHMF